MQRAAIYVHRVRCFSCYKQEIVALRDELAVVNRLARAQDRKFDGSEGYAMARRLWVAEEEQRTARSAVTSLTAEVRLPGLHRAVYGTADE